MNKLLIDYDFVVVHLMCHRNKAKEGEKEKCRKISILISALSAAGKSGNLILHWNFIG
jgi:hypothetical protein